MKKYLLLSIAALTISSFSFSQNVNIPDANFKAYLVGHALINTNSDTEIQVTEANSYTGLINCPSQSISDLTGIEEFTSLTGLYCYNNFTISSIDVSMLTDLEQLYCSSNAITQLDLSNNPNLVFLACDDNELVSLNIANGNNTNIPNGSFYANSNPNLSCIQVDDIAYSTSTWTNVDGGVSYSLDCNSCIVTIPDANFKAYLVGNLAINTNSDTEIQCSEAASFNGNINVNSLSISNLAGIEAFTALTSLSCTNNQLTSLDVSSNTSLTDLNCNVNQIISLVLGQNSGLGFLRCADNLLTDIDVSANTGLITLNVSGNAITSLDLSNNLSLLNLECHWNSLTSLDVSNNANLSTLRCYNNVNITSLDLSNNSVLTIIQCQDNWIAQLNVANGNNTAITSFNATGIPAICIQVDDAAYSTTNWTNIDAIASFSENCVSSIGNTEYALNTISLFPNPTSTILSIDAKEEIIQIQILNLLGEVVQVEEKLTFSVEQLPVGVYMVQLQTTQEIINLRFVKN